MLLVLLTYFKFFWLKTYSERLKFETLLPDGSGLIKRQINLSCVSMGGWSATPALELHLYTEK